MLENQEILIDLEKLLGVSIISMPEEDNFNLYIRRAITLIKNYLNNDTFTSEYVKSNFQDAIIEIVTLAYKSKGKENISSITQGARSVAYSDGTNFAITKNVKKLLPRPFLKMF